ncbi:MAG TPA: 3'-5' exonuclease, partial [Phnomibacter sp.]|nr:3'-5' exonuclease [Phnomibacter sp.]
MFAIVDIETTGGSAGNSGITEIAIVLHNGREVEGKFATLINPQQKIPRYITALTGISDYMVADAPTFEQIADRIFNLLQHRVFVAHNVNFDYSFVLNHLVEAGFQWQARKLCTVRYARKVMPGHPSYHTGSDDRWRAANWINEYTLKNVHAELSAEAVFAAEVQVDEPLSESEAKTQATELSSLRDWELQIRR